MEVKKQSGQGSPATKPVLTQTENNTTLWIGHSQSDPTDHLAGQTFTCPGSGILNNIQLYSAAVNIPGELLLTLHEFDERSKSWGRPLCEARQTLGREDDGHWIRFTLEPVQLQKGATYGFKIQSPDAMIGLGEAAHHARAPFSFGHAWNGSSNNKTGHFFDFFSLAFKIEICA